MSRSIYPELRKELTFALGEAQTENPYVAAGIAMEIVRAKLERCLAGTPDGAALIQELLAR